MLELRSAAFSDTREGLNMRKSSADKTIVFQKSMKTKSINALAKVN
jgi:hypothetical protein